MLDNEAERDAAARSVARAALDIDWRNTESQARMVAEYAADELAALRARVAELEAWLRKDARHAPRCMMLDQYDERDFGCTCGLDALRAGPSAGAAHGEG